MSLQSLFAEPRRINEPQAIREYADVLSRVAAEGKPVIIRRNGAGLAAVIPLEHLDLVREVLARDKAEMLATEIAWERAADATSAAVPVVGAMAVCCPDHLVMHLQVYRAPGARIRQDLSGAD